VITLATGLILSIYGETIPRIMNQIVTLVIEIAVVFNLDNIYSWIVIKWIRLFRVQNGVK